MNATAVSVRPPTDAGVTAGARPAPVDAMEEVEGPPEFWLDGVPLRRIRVGPPHEAVYVTHRVRLSGNDGWREGC